MEKEEENFESKFEKIYAGICKNCDEKLKENRTKLNKVLLIVFGILICINIIIYVYTKSKEITVLLITISICIILFMIIKSREIYKKSYKSCVISSLVKLYNPKLYFDDKSGISKYDYTMSNFDNNFDEFFSEDKIYGSLENGTKIRIAEIVTNIISKSKSGDTTYEDKTQTYRGMYGVIKLPYNITSSIYIFNDSIMERYSKDRIEIDSAEFEKYYDCISEEKVRTLRILTSEVIEKFNDIRRYSKNEFELKIENEMIYFRFKCGQIFEPPILGNGLDKELIKKYYSEIYFPIELIQKLSESIENFMEQEE